MLDIPSEHRCVWLLLSLLLCWDLSYSDISEAHHHLLGVVGSDMIGALTYA